MQSPPTVSGPGESRGDDGYGHGDRLGQQGSDVEHEKRPGRQGPQDDEAGQSEHGHEQVGTAADIVHRLAVQRVHEKENDGADAGPGSNPTTCEYGEQSRSDHV